MSVSTDISRLGDDSQPSPKRRKNSDTNSTSNGYDQDKPTTCHHTKTPRENSNSIISDNGKAAVTSSTSSSSTSSTSSSSTSTTTASANNTESETIPLVSEGTICTPAASVVVNGTTNANEGRAEPESTNGNAAQEETGQSLKRNQFGEVSDGHMSLQDWLTQWRKGKTRFTLKAPHRMLVKHHDRLVEGKTKPRFLLPCCGKSLDIKWLLDKGYPVVGVEVAEMACIQFFEEHDLEFEEEVIKDGPEGKIFKGVDCDVRIYVCDFFSVTSALTGLFDCIWDRGSYAAMNPADRQRYCDTISKLLKEDGRYLLDCFKVDHKVFAGPPHNTAPGELEELFGDTFNVEQLEDVDVMNDWSRSWGVTYFYENDYMLTHKTKK